MPRTVLIAPIAAAIVPKGLDLSLIIDNVADERATLSTSAVSAAGRGDAPGGPAALREVLGCHVVLALRLYLQDLEIHEDLEFPDLVLLENHMHSVVRSIHVNLVALEHPKLVVVVSTVGVQGDADWQRH